MKIVLINEVVVAAHADSQIIVLTDYPGADKICYVPDKTGLASTSIGGDIVDPRNLFDIDVLRECVRTDINNVTDNLFLTTVVAYGGVDFPITKENQFDYKAVVDEARAGFITYPYRIKGVGSTYYQIQDLADANAFYLTGMTAVQTILQTGWALKDSLAAMTHQQLLDFTDPRI